MGMTHLQRLIPFTCLLALALCALGCGGTAGRTDTPAALGGTNEAAAPESNNTPSRGNDGGLQGADVTIPDAAEIVALPAPDGVDTDVWALLTDELSRVLAECQGLPDSRGHSSDADSRNGSGGVPAAGLSRSGDANYLNGSGGGPAAGLLPIQPGTKVTSSPPTGDAGVVELSYFEPTSTLRWLYVNSGDYDQNGIVGVSDLTPLGVHFGEESPGGAGTPFPAESLGAAIDGNSDGLIGVGDITPIGQNFGRRVEGYRVYVGTEDSAPPAEPNDPNGPGTALVGELLLSAADSTAGRLRFYRQVVPTQSEQYYWVRPYHGEEDGSASNSVHVLLPPPQPPVAALTPTGDTATLAHIVWDAGASHDPDGQIVKYEWDFDGDGVYEYDSTGADSVDFYYYAPGEYGCTVRVTDGDGMTDTATAGVQVTESATWHDNVADTLVGAEGVGQWPVLLNPEVLDVSGQPALLYTRQIDEPDPVIGGTTNAAYLRAEDAQGERWPEPQLIVGTAGSGPALVVDGRPAFVSTYYKLLEPPNNYPRESGVSYLRAGNPEGSTWTLREEIGKYTTDGLGNIVSGTDFGLPLAVMLLDSAPAVLGRHAYPGEPFFFTFKRALNATGSSWPEEYATSDSLTSSSKGIGTVADRLALVRQENQEDLLYYRNPDLGQLGWEQGVLVDKLERVDTNYALLEADGLPAVVYYDALLSGIKYRRAADPSGTTWNDFEVVSVAAAGKFSAAVIDGRPTVMFVDRIDDVVKMVAANDAQGAHWGFASDIPVYAEAQIYPNVLPLADVAGLPAYTYSEQHTINEDDHETSLHYAAYY